MLKVSVIIPVYNAEGTIVQCIESILNQSISKDICEIIVVDDGSTDSTKSILQGFKGIKFISQSNQGPAVARNKGAREALGEILVFTDSDCELKRNFLEEIIKAYEKDPSIVGMQGRYKTKQKEFVAKFGQAEIETRYSKMQKKKYIDFIGTYAASYKKDIFLKYNGFDTGFPIASGEDSEFSYRLSRDGHKLIFNEKAIVYHTHPTSWKKYFKVKFYRGLWRLRLYKKHPDKIINDSYTTQLIKLETLSVPFLILVLLISIFQPLFLLLLLPVILIYLFDVIIFWDVFKVNNYKKKFLIPVLIFLRALAIFLGISTAFCKRKVTSDG